MLQSIIVAAVVNAFVVQVIALDEITVPIRGFLEAREGRIGLFFARVVSCYRCTGVWTSGPVAALTLGSWPWQAIRPFLLVAASASFVQYALMRWLDAQHPSN